MQNEVTQAITEVVKQKVANAVSEIGKIVVKNDDDMSRAATILSNVKKLQKFIKQSKDKILNPLKESVKATKELFEPMEFQMENAEATLKLAMIRYQNIKEAEIVEKQNAIAARAQKEGPGSLKPETAIKKMEELGEVKTNIKTETGATTFTKIKKIRVVDQSKVPDQYWMIDMVILREEALKLSKINNALGELIPGVEVYEETSVSAK